MNANSLRIMPLLSCLIFQYFGFVCEIKVNNDTAMNFFFYSLNNCFHLHRTCKWKELFIRRFLYEIRYWEKNIEKNQGKNDRMLKPHTIKLIKPIQ